MLYALLYVLFDIFAALSTNENFCFCLSREKKSSIDVFVLKILQLSSSYTEEVTIPFSNEPSNNFKYEPLGSKYCLSYSRTNDQIM